MRRLLLLCCALVVLAACGGGGPGADNGITVGAVSFAENQIVAEMYAAVLQEAGISVDRRFNFQDRESLLPDLRAGEVDLVPEYLASLLTALDPEADVSSDPAENIAALRPLLAEPGLELLTPSEANDTNAIVVAEKTARRLDLQTVSDLRSHADTLVFGGPPECPQREFCIKGLRQVYGLEFKKFRALDAGGPLTVAALGSGEIDVALLFSTSGVIADRGWVLLEDDKDLQAAENITPVVRTDVLTDEIERLLSEVSAVLTTKNVTELNARVEVNNEDFRDVARDFLEREGLI